VYVRHPELAAAKANRDYVFKQVCEAVNTISDVAQGKGPTAPQHPYDGPGELAAALDDFDVRTVFSCFVFTYFGLPIAQRCLWELSIFT
jgi:catenin alpha